MKPTLYPNGFPSAYEELKTFYPVFYRDVFEMDAIWRAAGGGLDEIEDGVDAVVNNNFVSLMDTDTLAQMETFLGIPLNQKRTLEARRKLVALYFIGGNHIGSQEIKDIVFGYTGASSSVECTLPEDLEKEVEGILSAAQAQIVAIINKLSA